MELLRRNVSIRNWNLPIFCSATFGILYLIRSHLLHRLLTIFEWPQKSVANQLEPQEAFEDQEAPDVEDLEAPGAERPSWGATEVKKKWSKAVLEATRDQSQVSQDDRHLPGRQRIFVKTYGCAHNNSDSEFMMGLLQSYGYCFTESWQEADCLVVNSCTVKGPSQDSSVNLVKAARDHGKAVVLAGCVPTADGGLAKSLEGVSMLGVSQLDRVVEVVEQSLQGHQVSLLNHRSSMPSLDLPKAVAEGVSEIWLTSEDTGAYGIDIGSNIASLLHRVADALPSHVMLKLGMTNPPYMLAHIDAVAEVLRRPNVFEYLHVPVQSGSDAVLRAMVREYTRADFERLVDGLRSQVPDLFIGTDVICGFPAEGEEDHQTTMDLVKKYCFPMLNISQFYPRPNTAAARLKRLPGQVVKARSTEMTQLFESYKTWDHLAGQTMRVWFSETDERRGQTVGHTKGYAKVVVKRDDKLLGNSAMVHLHSATKWHVDGMVIGS
eukprot:g27831.t1